MGGLEQIRQGHGKGRKSCHVCVVIVGHPQEALQLLDGARGMPTRNRGNFRGVHPTSPLAHEMAEVLYFLFPEAALTALREQAVVAQLL